MSNLDELLNTTEQRVLIETPLHVAPVIGSEDMEMLVYADIPNKLM